MANILANIERTMPKVVDKAFARESLTERLIGKNTVKIDFVGARVVKIFKIQLSNLQNYVRGGHQGENASGSVKSELETFTLSQERYIEIKLDRLDTVDDAETVLGVASSELLRTKVIPEFDAYRFSKLAGYTSTTFGNRVEEDIAENTIIKKFNEAFRWMARNKVATKDQIFYVSTAVMEQIRNTNELYKHLTQEEYKDGDVSFTVTKYEGREIVEVPDDEFFTDIVIGDGYAPSATSKAINFLLVDKTSPIIIRKLDYAKLFSSESVYLGGYVGYVLQNLYYHDLFVPDNKEVAIYCSVSASTKGIDVASVLLAGLKAGSTGKTVLEKVNTIPQGTLLDKYYLATSATAPAIGTAVSGLTEITVGGEFTPNATHNFIVGSYGGKVMVVSKDFGSGIPKGA